MTNRLRPISPAQRRRILKRDSYTCVYCFELATECDHIIPYSYIPDNTDANLVASCRLCNSIAGSMVFDSFNMKYQYIKREREKRIRPQNPEWHMRAVRAMMEAQEEAPEPVKVIKPKKVKVVKPPKPKVEKPPKVKVVKPTRAKVERTPRIVEPLKVMVDAAMFLGYSGPAMTVLVRDADGKESYTFGVPWENLPKFIQDRIWDKYFKSE